MTKDINWLRRKAMEQSDHEYLVELMNADSVFIARKYFGGLNGQT